MSEVVNEIKRQLIAQGVNLKGKYLVKVDDNTLRVHKPSSVIGKGDSRSVDIKYNKGSDLYDVSVHTIDNNTFKIKTCRSKGVYFDSLPNYFNKKIQNRMCKK